MSDIVDVKNFLEKQMNILLLIFFVGFVGCSTNEGPKNEDTKMLWGQEDKSIEQIFSERHEDDSYHTKKKFTGFWADEGNGRFPSSKDCDCDNNKNTNYRNVTSLHGVNKNGLTDQINTYRVRDKHETLMLVAYKIYGDYALWREIADLNGDVLGGRLDITPGMLLKYRVPQEGYTFTPEGNPFLVRKGHSLSIISDLVYRDWRRWKDIFAHNQPFIKNSNLIYEGSTLFYVPDANVAGKSRVGFPTYARKKSGKSRTVASTTGSEKHYHSDGCLHDSHNDHKRNVSSSDLSTQKSKVVKKKVENVLTKNQVEAEDITPVQKAQFSQKSIHTIERIKKVIENTHGDTEINGSSKFDRYVEKNFID